MNDLILFNKPFNVLCQFTDDNPQAPKRKTLTDYIKQKGFYAAGRLDHDSEGLLLLTNNGKLQHKITNPMHKMPKTYWVQVEGEVSKKAIICLTTGVELKESIARPAQCCKIAEPSDLWQRKPPIRKRQNIPTSWIELTIIEGKNRQVRRMTAAVGYPTLRLIRVCVGHWKINNLQPGEYEQLYNQYTR